MFSNIFNLSTPRQKEKIFLEVRNPLKTLGFYKKIPLKDYSSRGISSDSKGNRTPKKTLKPA